MPYGCAVGDIAMFFFILLTPSSQGCINHNVFEAVMVFDCVPEERSVCYCYVLAFSLFCINPWLVEMGCRDPFGKVL